MSQRGVYVSKTKYPFFEEIQVSFDWFGGFALSQKRKNELGAHLNFDATYPGHKLLEVSSASIDPLGTKLSAMALHKRTKDGITAVESCFQSSRIYLNGEEQIGPFPEYLFSDGREAKKRVKELSQGLHSYQYKFEGITFYAPDFHISLFYDYLYLSAMMEEENRATREALLSGRYDAFTDLATKALNSQARSCAIFVGLHRAGLLSELMDVESYLKLFRCTSDGKAIDSTSYEDVQLLQGKPGVILLSPAAPCVIPAEKIKSYYDQHYGHLSNKKQK